MSNSRKDESEIGRELMEKVGLQDFEVAVMGRAFRSTRPEIGSGGDRSLIRHVELSHVRAALRRDVLFPDLKWEGHVREIMGKSFYGLQEVSLAIGREFSDRELEKLSKFPFVVELIRQRKENHVLVASCDVKPADLMERYKERFAPGQIEKILGRKEYPMALQSSWVLFRTEPAPQSAGMGFEDQVKLLTRDEQVPLLWTVLYVMLVTGQEMFKGKFVRTSWYGCRDPIAVGCPTPAGIEIRECWGDTGYPDIWVASEFLK